jgi:hypothetical protein
MSLDFSIFLDYNLQFVPIWSATYIPDEDRYVCHCPRKSYCVSAGKHPINSHWAETPRPLNTPETIKEIQNSKCNFAIAGGEIPNTNTQLVILDVDTPAINSDFVKELPPTLTVISRSQALHFYYTLPLDIPVKNISNGYIDLRGPSAYAVAPPSKFYTFSPYSLPTITHLPTLPEIPSNPSNSPRDGSKSLPGIYTPYESYITSDGLVGRGGRDQYVFHELVTLVNAGHSLNSLLQQADTIHSQLEQPTRDPYTVQDIRSKAYYVYDRYHDPETQALREAMDLTYPPA